MSPPRKRQKLNNQPTLNSNITLLGLKEEADQILQKSNVTLSNSCPSFAYIAYAAATDVNFRKKCQQNDIQPIWSRILQRSQPDLIPLTEKSAFDQLAGLFHFKEFERNANSDKAQTHLNHAITYGNLQSLIARHRLEREFLTKAYRENQDLRDNQIQEILHHAEELKAHFKVIGYSLYALTLFDITTSPSNTGNHIQKLQYLELSIIMLYKALIMLKDAQNEIDHARTLLGDEFKEIPHGDEDLRLIIKHVHSIRPDKQQTIFPLTFFYDTAKRDLNQSGERAPTPFMRTATPSPIPPHTPPSAQDFKAIG